MKLRLEKNSCWVEDVEGRRRPLRRWQVAVGRAGTGGASRHPRGSQGCGSRLGALQVSMGKDGSGGEGSALRGDPPAGAAGAVGRTLIASPCENAFIHG